MAQRLYPATNARHQYAMAPGDQPLWPGATAIAKLASDLGGLSWAAAKETALFAFYHQDEWMSLAPEKAIDRLYKHHKGIWDAKKNRGTLVHDLALGWAQGKVVEVPPDCDPYMDALERFWVDHQPKFVTCERIVIHDAPGLEYGGRLDTIADLADSRRWLLDYKTGKRYPVETILQLAAYRYAKHLAVTDGFDRLVDVEPMMPVDTVGVLYLHDDGTYELLELPADESAHEVFLYLRRVWAWNRLMATWEKAHPAPKPEEAVA